MTGIKIDFLGHLDAQKRLALLTLSPRKRRQLLGGFGREIKRQSIRNLNAQLAVRKAEWLELGNNTLEQVNTAEIGGQVALVEQYKRAVFCRAVGLLLMAFATINRREQAENLAKESDDTNQYFLAQSGRAIRRLLGLTENVSVELL